MVLDGETTNKANARKKAAADAGGYSCRSKKSLSKPKLIKKEQK
jgi:hypothetical protein